MHQLSVRVNEDLVLDAGSWKEVADESSGFVYREIIPPETVLYDQLINYLKTRLPREPVRAPTSDEEALAAVAVCLRWGSYLCVLADETLPERHADLEPGASLISNEEMARINIEASATLEDWLRRKRATPLIYGMFVKAALSLPLPINVKIKPVFEHYSYLSAASSLENMSAFKRAVRESPPADVDTRLAELEEHPMRVLANSLLQYCWRRNNNPVEELHGGGRSYYPLETRRLTSKELRLILTAAARNFTSAFMAINSQNLLGEGHASLSERLLPFHFNSNLKCPDWSMTEMARSVRLDGPEPPKEDSSRKKKVRRSKI